MMIQTPPFTDVVSTSLVSCIRFLFLFSFVAIDRLTFDLDILAIDLFFILQCCPLSFYYEEQSHLSAAIATIDDGNVFFVDSTYSFEDLGAASPSIMRYEVD